MTSILSNKIHNNNHLFSLLLPQPPLTAGNKLLIILLSVFIHYLLFYTLPYKYLLSNQDIQNRKSTIKAARNKYNKRMIIILSYSVSIVHSVVALLYVTYFYITFNVDLTSIQRTFGNGIYGTGDEYISYMICWSIGYFIYDLLCMIQYNSALYNTGSYIHHVLMIICFSGGTFIGNMSPFHFYLLLEEFSTPPLNMKTLLKHYGKLSDYCGIVFAISFFLCRIIYGSYVFYCGIPNFVPFVSMSYNNKQYIDAIHVSLQLFLFLMTRLLNFYWMFLIAKKLYATLFGRKSAKSVAVDETQVEKSLQHDMNTIEKDIKTYTNGSTSNNKQVRNRSRNDN